MAEGGIVTVASGCFVGVIGLQIKYAGATQLIAGYALERVTDEEGLAGG